jgi:hypothetical protein
MTLYEEVHPMSRATSLEVHRAFLKTLNPFCRLNAGPFLLQMPAFALPGSSCLIAWDTHG